MLLNKFRIFSVAILFISIALQVHASSIISVRSFSETTIDHPYRSDGWRLHLSARISDPLGVPENIASVTVSEINGVDPIGLYSLNYRTGKQDYNTHIGFPVAEGSAPLQYEFSVTNNQNEVVSLLNNPIDTIRQLDAIQNLALSDFGVTPTFSFDTIQYADKYRMVIAAGDNSRNIWASDWLITDAPSFTVPLGVLEPGSSYFFRAEAGDFNTSDLDGIDDLENRSVRFFAVTTVPLPSAIWFFGSGLVALIGITRRKNISV